jgi:hypothetical protein
MRGCGFVAVRLVSSSAGRRDGKPDGPAPGPSVRASVSGRAGAVADAPHLPTPARVATGDAESGGAAVASVQPAFWRPVDGKPGAVRLGRLSEDALADLENRAIARKFPDALPRRVADTSLVESWADFLAPHFAQGEACNLTGTYSDAYGYPHGLMLARNVIKDFEAFRRLLGRHTSPACIGVELAPQGRLSGRPILHFHAMLGGTWSAADLANAQERWTDTRGWAVAKSVTDRAGCVEYAAKHLLKQGHEDNFAFMVGREYGSRSEQRFARRARKESSSTGFSDAERRSAGVVRGEVDGMPVRVAVRASEAR